MDGQPRRIGAPVLVLLGPPGAGKEIQSRLLEERYGLLRLSVADLQREAAARPPVVPAADDCAVPDQALLAVLADRLDRPDVARGLVLAGFPQTLAQAEALDEMLAARGLAIGAAVTLTRGEADEAGSTRPAYHVRTAPLIEHFARRGVLLRIDATRATEEVTLSLGGIVRALRD